MKKILILAAALMIQGCISGGDGQDASGGDIRQIDKPAEKALIGFAIPYKSSWLSDGAGFMKGKAEAMGYDFMSLQADSSIAEYESHIEKLISLGAKIIITRKDWNFPREIESLKKASLAGIKIITFDMFFEVLEYCDYNITYNFPKIGEMQAETIINALDSGIISERNNIVLFAGSSADNMAYVLFDSAMEKLNPYIDSGRLAVLGPYPRDSKSRSFWDICIESWDTQAAAEKMKHLLEDELSGIDIDAILCPNDSLAVGIISAYENLGYSQYPVITAMDATPEAVRLVSDGKLKMTVLKSIKTLAEGSILLADALLKGEEPEIPASENGMIKDGYNELPSVFIYPEIVTAENLKEVLINGR